MIIVLMGVAGAGKTTVGRMLARQLRWEFADADDYHPQSNVEKMRQGIALDDADRWPWLEALVGILLTWRAKNLNGVLACSALKITYRNKLKIGPEVEFVFLYGSESLIGQRLRLRSGHFADGRILESQLADLEEPEGATKVSIDRSPKEIVGEIKHRLGLAQR